MRIKILYNDNFMYVPKIICHLMPVLHHLMLMADITYQHTSFYFKTSHHKHDIVWNGQIKFMFPSEDSISTVPRL